MVCLLLLLLKVVLQLVWELSTHLPWYQLSCQTRCCQPYHLWHKLSRFQPASFWEKGSFLCRTSWSNKLYSSITLKWGNWCQRLGWKMTRRENIRCLGPNAGLPQSLISSSGWCDMLWWLGSCQRRTRINELPSHNYKVYQRLQWAGLCSGLTIVR
jgi:hypothetical protein